MFFFCISYTTYIQIQWIPVHIEPEGNEKADTLAKHGGKKVHK